MPPEEMPEVLTPAEVAKVFAVDPQTITRWADGGKLPHFRTLGGHRRFRRVDVRRLLDERSGLNGAAA